METKEVILKMRKDNKLSQNEMAERLHVTRQAVSRWENGDTIPDTDTLVIISKEFNISVNTLLGAPRKLICQCCGMPLMDEYISREPDNTFNEEYCKWCYVNGEIVYTFDSLIDYLVEHRENKDWKEEDARKYFAKTLKQLNYWKN